MQYAKSLCILHAMIYLMKINHTFFQSLQDNLFMRFGHRLAHHYQDVRARGSHTARKRRNTTLHNLRPGVLLEEFFIFFFCKTTCLQSLREKFQEKSQHKTDRDSAIPRPPELRAVRKVFEPNDFEGGRLAGCVTNLRMRCRQRRLHCGRKGTT